MAVRDRTNASMAAAVFHGNERITIERVRIPDVGPGEVLVRVSRTALCGSDFKLWHKGAEFTAGHEIFGVVEQPGHRMDGRRCAVYIPVHCGHCDACRRGDTQMCLEDFQPDRLEQAGRLCGISAGPGKLSAAGAR